MAVCPRGNSCTIGYGSASCLSPPSGRSAKGQARWGIFRAPPTHPRAGAVAKQPPSKRPAKTRSFHSKIAGVTHRNPDGSSRQRIIRKYCRPGVELELIHEPDNLYSETALGLWVQGGLLGGAHHVGYLRDELGEELLDDIENGKGVRVFISEVTGGGWFKNYGVNIRVEVTDDPGPGWPALKVIRGHGGSRSILSWRSLVACLVVAIAACVVIAFLPTRKPEPARPAALPAVAPAKPAIGGPIARDLPWPIAQESAPLATPPAHDQEAKAKPAGPWHSTRAATMLKASKNLEDMEQTRGAIESYRDVVMKFPGTVEAEKAALRLKALGGKVPGPSEYKPVEE